MQHIVEDIFLNQSPLSAAQFEAAWRSHPEVNKERLSNLVKAGWSQFKLAGHARLRPWLRKGVVVKSGKIYRCVSYGK
jgi:hypothetical protein